MQAKFYTILLILIFLIAIIAVGKLISFIIEDNNKYKKRNGRFK
jgi:uncharacterized membrane protein